MVQYSENAEELSEEKLFSIFPYLREEFEELRKETFGKKRTVRLLSAQLIHTNTPDIPDPSSSISVDSLETHVSRILVDIIDRKKRTHLYSSCDWTYPCTLGVSKGSQAHKSLAPFHEKGDETGDVLFRMSTTPLFIVIKEIYTTIIYNNPQQEIFYRITAQHLLKDPFRA
ncbi:MAG: hypothetical protein Q8R18_06050 [bacterium]|nr:hypothetical protein [bacterium]